MCPTGEKAFIDSRTNTPRQCAMAADGKCPGGYLCRFSQTNHKYYCCGSVTGGKYRPLKQSIVNAFSHVSIGTKSVSFRDFSAAAPVSHLSICQFLSSRIQLHVRSSQRLPGLLLQCPSFVLLFIFSFYLLFKLFARVRTVSTLTTRP